MATEIGRRIKDQRLKAGFSLDELARRTNSSKSYIWELENSDAVNPSHAKLMVISTALRVPVDFILNGFEKEDEENEEDKLFYRKYINLDDTKRKQIQKILDALDDEE